MLPYTGKISDLSEGVNLLHKGHLIVYKEGDILRACQNICKHRQGKFALSKNSKDCHMTCTLHGWVLDPKNMKYTNPTGDLKQEELIVTVSSGNYTLTAADAEMPWGTNTPIKKNISEREFCLQYYCHACTKVQLGDKVLFTDPWIEGPAFSGGWWLAHKAPENWLKELSAADYIYISHNHSDHLNEHTLRILAKERIDQHFLIPNFDSDSCESILKELGFTNIHTVAFNTWYAISEDARIMLFLDHTGRDDSGILIEYKGHRILSTVDCSNLNGGNLPQNIDVLLTSFAGGASGFPVCWQNLYSPKEIDNKLSVMRGDLRNKITKTLEACSPRIYIPYAGYFTEAHPADIAIKKVNIKNQPDDILKHVAKYNSNIRCLLPSTAASIDLSNDFWNPGEENPIRTEFHFKKYEIPKLHIDHPLYQREGLMKYFEWADFKGNLILHIQETSYDFEDILNEYYINFQDLSFSTKPIENKLIPYLSMKVRRNIFHYVLTNGLPWEEITIGFHALFYRNPDQYNFEFWKHFQDKLPKTKPFEELTHSLA